MPKKLIVVGAGYIALEFACIFNNLGAQVDVFIRGNGVLRGFDKEVPHPSRFSFPTPPLSPACPRRAITIFPPTTIATTLTDIAHNQEQRGI